MNYEQWIKYGVDKGFASPPYCHSHELHHPNDTEEFTELFNDRGGLDFCWQVMRIY